MANQVKILTRAAKINFVLMLFRKGMNQFLLALSLPGILTKYLVIVMLQWLVKKKMG